LIAPALEPRAAGRLFISYARVDRPAVSAFARALQAEGYDVWWDELIDGGASFAKVIETALDDADIVLVVWSAASVESDWVRDEAGRGRDRGRLLPVSLDGTQPPLGFRQYHSIDLSRWNRRPDASEIAAVARAIDTTRGSPERLPARVARRSRMLTRRRVLVAAGGCVVAAAAGGAAFLHPWSAAEAANGIAVMPFKNLSNDPAQTYFSDGLAEEIRGALAVNGGLKVAAPTSTNEFRGRDDDARAVGAALGVAHLLEGSVRTNGNVVRIVSSLIDASTGFSGWSQTFERKLVDIFAVQSEIATTVERALSEAVGTRGTRPGNTTNLAAYDLYLKGRALYDRDSGEASDRAALAKFDAALVIDPAYAAAYAARSRSIASMAGLYGAGDALRRQYDISAAAARRAVELAPQLAAGHAALGYALFTGLIDVAGAASSYSRAADYGHGDADILVLVAFHAAKTGQAKEALAAVRRAQMLDPLNPRTFRAEASVLNSARQFADAIGPAERALRMNAKLSNAYALIGVARYAMGEIPAAHDAFAAEGDRSFSLAGLAICAQRLGKASDAEASLKALITEFGDSAAYQQAQVYAQMGRADAAIDALGRAYTASDGGITNMTSDVILDPVRNDPRFQKLVADIGFT
jgi:TolB-like protein/tetratricopeptide (TPR) repeat protein